MTWQAFVVNFVVGLTVTLGLAGLFVAIMNPYGNLPMLVFADHVIMDSNQRYQYPSIARSQRFDSVVIGTSSSRLLDPALLESKFGGKFANLGLNNGRAWEQIQLLKLYLRHNPKPRTIIIGIDYVWCMRNADTRRITNLGFPAWMYDEDPWNDWLFALNSKSVEIAGRQLGYRLGLQPAAFPANGFKVFVPPDASYDAKKAHDMIWQPSKSTQPTEPDDNAADQPPWTFPALAWLAEALAEIHHLPAASTTGSPRVIILFVPAHASTFAAPGSKQAQRDNACKEAIIGLASAPNTFAVDFQFASKITAKDENFWDTAHYRLPIASLIIEGLAAAVIEGKAQASDGTWRLRRAGDHHPSLGALASP